MRLDLYLDILGCLIDVKVLGELLKAQHELYPYVKWSVNGGRIQTVLLLVEVGGNQMETLVLISEMTRKASASETALS